MRRTLVMLVVVVTCVLLTPTAVGAGSGDQAIADDANLKLEDVPAGFQEVAGPEDDDDNGVDCSARIESVDDAAQAAPNSDLLYALPQDAGFAIIGSQVAVFKKTRPAKKLLNAYQNETDAEACFEAVLDDYFNDTTAFILAADVEISTSSFSPETDDKGSTDVVTGGDEYAGYAASVSRAVEGGAPQFFESQLIVGRVGRSVFRLSLVAGGTIPRDDVQAMMQAVVDRLQDA